MRDLADLFCCLLEGIDLLGIYCRVDRVMIAMNILSIRIAFLYLYIYKLLWRSVLDLSCSFTKVVIAAIMLNDYRSRKYQTKEMNS